MMHSRKTNSERISCGNRCLFLIFVGSTCLPSIGLHLAGILQRRIQKAWLGRAVGAIGEGDGDELGLLLRKKWSFSLKWRFLEFWAVFLNLGTICVSVPSLQILSVSSHVALFPRDFRPASLFYSDVFPLWLSPAIEHSSRGKYLGAMPRGHWQCAPNRGERRRRENRGGEGKRYGEIPSTAD